MNHRSPSVVAVVLSLFPLLGCGVDGVEPGVEGEEGEGEEGEGEADEGEEGEGEEGEGEEGEGEGEIVIVEGSNAANADGTDYVFNNVIAFGVVDGRVAYQVADDTGYWSMELDVPDSPGSFTCDDALVWVFSDFFRPFSSEHPDSTCGIEVTAAPYTDNRFSGTYQGTLVSSDPDRAERVIAGRFDLVVE